MDSTKRPCFLDEDDGLASLPDIEAGYSGCNHHYPRYQHGFVSRSLGFATSFNRRSFRNLSDLSPRSGRFYDARFEDPQPHFLDACFLCKKPLGENRDIFMYRLEIFLNYFTRTKKAPNIWFKAFLLYHSRSGGSGLGMDIDLISLYS